ncbi:MAG: hypothetical protein AB7F19_01100 [Candidatus Babeliales bacterium]
MLRLFVVLSFVAMPAMTCAMDDLDNEPKTVVSYPRYALAKIKDASLMVVETAWDHPKSTLVIGAVVGGIVISKYLFASQRDLNATAGRLRKHRTAEMARVVEVKDVHDRDTQENFDQFGQRQEALVAVIGKAQGNLNATQETFYALLVNAEALGLQQSAIFGALKTAMSNAAQTAQQEAQGINEIQHSADVIVARQGATTKLSAILLSNMGSAKADLQSLLEQLRQCGENTEEIEERVRQLLAQLQARNPQLIAARQDNTIVQLLEEDQVSGK